MPILSRCSHSVAAAVALAAAAAACAPGPPPPATSAGGPRPNRANAPLATLSAPPPRYVVGHFGYDVQSVGLVSSAGDTNTRTDTVTTHSSVSYEARWDSGQMRVVGRVEYQVALTSGLRPAAPTPPRSTAVLPSPTATSRQAADTAPVETRRVAFNILVDTATGISHRTADGLAVPACQSGGPAVEQDEALATDRPRALTPSSTWTDTLTRVSCLAGIPLTTRTARQVTVAPTPAPDPVSGMPAVVVTYQIKGTMDGEARRNVDLVTLHSTGDGSAEQYYDRVSGVLLSAHATSTWNLDLAINGRIQHLHQQADWRAVARR